MKKKKKSILAPRAIIYVSEHTKDELLKRYFLPEERITVIYLSSEINIDLSYGSEPVPKHPYYIFVGTRFSYKNFDGLLNAFAKVVSVRPKSRFCIVGLTFNDSESNFIDYMNLSNYIEHSGYVSDSHLAKLYRCSIALIYPSFYEGFGIPPREAMSWGTVPVVADSSSLPEVVGDAGILFNPKLTLDLADLLIYLPDNLLIRDSLIAKGYDRAKMFHWNKAVDQTIKVYRSVTNLGD